MLCTYLIRLSIAYIALSLLCFVVSLTEPEPQNILPALDVLLLLVWLASVVFLCMILKRFKAALHKGQLVQQCFIAWGIFTIIVDLPIPMPLWQKASRIL